MYTQKQILEFISKSKPMLRKKFHVPKIGLFGSYARQQQSASSDIDLIVEFDEKYIKPRYRERILNEAIYVY